VLLDGRAVFACHLLALQAAGREVVTIEGLARGERLHPIQEAFVEHDALQCGFCTPGMILAVKAALDRDPHASRGSLQHALAGNLCRCAAYPHILDAASAAARRLREG
jgi:aerobic-type carbon monoxide dehydrogenase small subunit (CoxS/CutS family)